jgi:hypothetical protein
MNEINKRSSGRKGPKDKEKGTKHTNIIDILDLKLSIITKFL